MNRVRPLVLALAAVALTAAVPAKAAMGRADLSLPTATEEATYLQSHHFPAHHYNMTHHNHRQAEHGHRSHGDGTHQRSTATGGDPGGFSSRN